MSSPKAGQRRDDTKGDASIPGSPDKKDKKEKKKTKEAPKSARAGSDKSITSLAEKKRKRLSASLVPDRRSSSSGSSSSSSGRRGTTGSKTDVKRDKVESPRGMTPRMALTSLASHLSLAQNSPRRSSVILSESSKETKEGKDGSKIDRDIKESSSSSSSSSSKDGKDTKDSSSSRESKDKESSSSSRKDRRQSTKLSPKSGRADLLSSCSASMMSDKKDRSRAKTDPVTPRTKKNEADALEEALKLQAESEMEIGRRAQVLGSHRGDSGDIGMVGKDDSMIDQRRMSSRALTEAKEKHRSTPALSNIRDEIKAYEQAMSLFQSHEGILMTASVNIKSPLSQQQPIGESGLKTTNVNASITTTMTTTTTTTSSNGNATQTERLSRVDSLAPLRETIALKAKIERDSKVTENLQQENKALAAQVKELQRQLKEEKERSEKYRLELEELRKGGTNNRLSRSHPFGNSVLTKGFDCFNAVIPDGSEKTRVLVFHLEGLRVLKPYSEELCSEFSWKSISQWNVDNNLKIFTFSVSDPAKGKLMTHSYAITEVDKVQATIRRIVGQVEKERKTAVPKDFTSPRSSFTFFKKKKKDG